MGWGYRKNKFGNTRVEYDGRSFHSKLEGSAYLVTKSDPNITILKMQQHIHIYSEDIKIGEFWPDFTLLDIKNNEIFWRETKGGHYNSDWPWKLNLWRAGGPGKLEIWSGNYKNPFLLETVIPKTPGLHIRKEQVYGKI